VHYYSKIEFHLTDHVGNRFLIQRIMAVNIFGSVRSTLNRYRNRQDAQSKAGYKSETEPPTGGLWTNASYINHCCFGTAHRSFIGDMMIVRASMDLDAGSEITMWYAFNSGDPAGARDNLSSWGFECTCVICDEAKQTPPAVMAKRKQLSQDILRACMTLAQTNCVASIEKMVTAFNKTYQRPATEVPRLSLWPAQLLMVVVYAKQEKPSRVLKHVQQFLAAMSFIVKLSPFRIVKGGLVMDDVVCVLKHAYEAFVNLGQIDNARRAEAYTRLAYRVVVGEDTSFDATYRVR
jgi:hypothetical protein